MRDERRRAERYGGAHRRARRELRPAAIGTPCTRCGEIMLADDELHLDHRDDGSGGYLGFAHARCNRSAGAIKGNRARGWGPLGSRSRQW